MLIIIPPIKGLRNILCRGIISRRLETKKKLAKNNIAFVTTVARAAPL